MFSIHHRHPHVVQVSLHFLNEFDIVFMKLEETNLVDANLKSQLTVDVSLTSTPALNLNLQPRHKPIPLDLLKRPLLNLKPYGNHDSDHEGTPSSSPKKKRKRRRKKKNSLIPSATDTKFDEVVNMSSSLK